MEIDKRNQEVVNKLNDCLRTELSAVQAYDLAVRHTTTPQVEDKLVELREDHQVRVDQLRYRLIKVGAEPVQSAGALGSFAKMVQSGADLLGDRAAVTTLEELEEWCLKAHTDALAIADDATREFIAANILPPQRRTHDLCRELKAHVKAAA